MATTNYNTTEVLSIAEVMTRNCIDLKKRTDSQNITYVVLVGII